MRLTVIKLTSQVIGSGVPKGKVIYRVSTEQGEEVCRELTRADARREAGLGDKSESE
jgi:hypothetical protein